MIQDKDVFREIIRLLGIGLLVYHIFWLAQISLGLNYYITDSTSVFFLMAKPFGYVLIGLYLLLKADVVAAFAYADGRLLGWSQSCVFIAGVKLSGLWLILVHWGSFMEQLHYYQQQIPLQGRYQILTHHIWTAIAVYVLCIVLGLVMLRYQPQSKSGPEGSRP